MEAVLDVEIQPLSPAVGATVAGVDLSRPLPPGLVKTIREALLEHGVLFFRDQVLTRPQMTAFMSRFGEPFPQPYDGRSAQAPPPEAVGETNLTPTRFSTAVWHADSTFLPEPPMATCLRAVSLPAVGGDTCWAGMYAAYEALSTPLARMLDGLTAVHSMHPTVAREPVLASSFAAAAKVHGDHAVHPVVRVHPETGRKALYVSECATTRIVELSPSESQGLLAVLLAHIRSPEFAIRWRWSPNDLAFWDNRCTQHYAVPNYETARVMQRMEIVGDKPRGPSS